MSWVNHLDRDRDREEGFFTRGERVLAILVSGAKVEGDFVAIARNQALILKNAIVTNGGRPEACGKAYVPMRQILIIVEGRP